MKKFKLFACVTCILAMGCFVLTACGDKNSTSGNNTQEQNGNGNAAGGANGDNALGDAVDDVADGIGNAVDEITSGFTNYSDAHDYFMKRMRADNPNAQYELRNESEDLTAYDGNTQGYHFELYDTATNSDGERIGDFYLEPKSGKVYQKDSGSGKFNEYQFASNSKGNNGGSGSKSDSGSKSGTNKNDTGAANR